MRSLLFVPGNRERMLERAPMAGADALILDLEDAVPTSEKETARRMVAQSLPSLAGQCVFVRINGLTTGYASEDLEATVGPGLAGVVLPKVEAEADVRDVDALLSDIERKQSVEPGVMELIVSIETARGVLAAPAIASASPRMRGLFFGSEDFTRDIGAELTSEGLELLYARSAVVVAAVAAGVQPIDAVYVNYQDRDGLERDARFGRQLGFKGKCVIHPSQVAIVNHVFSPTQEEIDWARRVVAAFADAEARGLATLSLDGRMVDLATLEKAHRLLAWADHLTQR
ncbi:MAG: CoA ester lyase [Chloroflexi bacterium]|nr:CoA ester lyase [Chloroflexota bacterium]